MHTDDLTAAVPGLDIPLDRQALAAATRLLADALAVKAPGASTEVRIPPYAVVQCVEGPRHTRGTPPNVVETDPLTWVRLATGRLTWKDAVAEAKLSASGERADLGALLPLLG
ncbi:sterol carrier family protein [Nocardia asteroides]|uniref:sterol carrier family protein n=1 Tax=Nocardia asteroides TaxID=1824 RepID=UPI0036507336